MRKKNLAVAIIIVVAVSTVGTVAKWEWSRISDASLIQRCDFAGPSATYEVSPEQAGNAATIAAVAKRRKLPERATTVALAAALQESKLIALDYGDRDSVGLFQQRPSQGWGPRQSLVDPIYASNKFFAALSRNPDWQSLPIADAAQAVQRSADGSAYAIWESQARVMSEVLNTDSYSLNCYLHRYATPSDSIIKRQAALVTEVKHLFPFTDVLEVQPTLLTITSSRAKNGQLAAWLVANADRYGIAAVVAYQHSWSRREWQKNAYNLSQIKVRFL
ncbi:MAG TPA: hypothetical protein VMV52_09340 [Candidatus Nanopelagicaceae bacterium]|nr:hypothetical protein [Candidatus Nanopelagicaceae bacterium]